MTSESSIHARSGRASARKPRRKRGLPPSLSVAARNVAGAAARLMAENGLTDFNAAKRKAVDILGLPANTPLPGNESVEAELKLYQRLFQGSEHAERLAALREKARELLMRLQKFTPCLTGPVLDGSAGRSAEIDIQLFTDSPKEVEVFLLGARIGFSHRAPRADRAETVLSFVDEGMRVNLIVYPSRMERVVFKTRAGQVRQRVRLEGLEQLVQQESQPFCEIKKFL
ncbi:MAG: hypothetical protein LBD67_07875 [Candidatus Accumulibacter sp.]|jgi:hypothetical protein|nr:hypothetical protein [Accumulibacter sp.]